MYVESKVIKDSLLLTGCAKGRNNQIKPHMLFTKAGSKLDKFVCYSVFF